jgi:hypothetical protein
MLWPCSIVTYYSFRAGNELFYQLAQQHGPNPAAQKPSTRPDSGLSHSDPTSGQLRKPNRMKLWIGIIAPSSPTPSRRMLPSPGRPGPGILHPTFRSILPYFICKAFASALNRRKFLSLERCPSCLSTETANSEEPKPTRCFWPSKRAMPTSSDSGGASQDICVTPLASKCE